MMYQLEVLVKEVEQLEREKERERERGRGRERERERGGGGGGGEGEGEGEGERERERERERESNFFNLSKQQADNLPKCTFISSFCLLVLVRSALPCDRSCFPMERPPTDAGI